MLKLRDDVMIILAVPLGVAIALVAISCAQRDRDAVASPPVPSRVVDQFTMPGPGGYNLNVTEFRDSAGNICVYVQKKFSEGVLSCSPPIIFQERDPE